ncbi:MAG: polysaccharide biosynthesis C-terminal domain-containing protein [Dysosmobacter sp.]
MTPPTRSTTFADLFHGGPAPGHLPDDQSGPRQGLENEKRRIFSTAIWLFFGLGLVCSVLMFFRADALARFLNNSLAATAVQALAPAVFCVCLLACMRGYTQGQGNMTPTAVSQVLEALLKLGIGLPLAWYVLHIGKTAELSAAGAIVGVTAGTAVSMLFLCAYLVTHRNRKESLDVPSSSGQIIKQILLIGVPITLSNSAMSIINIIDTKIVMGRLQNGLGLSETAAAVLNGQYRIAMNMPNMVASFVYPVTMSLIPSRRRRWPGRTTPRRTASFPPPSGLIAILALPAGVGLSVLSTPIERLMLPMQPEDALAAGPHLQILGIALIFICLMILTNAILQTYGKEKLPIFTVIAGGVVKVVMNYILVGNPDISIHGAPISTLCCYLTICGLNLFFVWKYSPEKPRYTQLFGKPIVASAVMGAAAWAVCGLVARVLSGHSAYGANALATFCGILAGVVVYGVLVITLRILQAEDVKALPKGEKIAKLLRLK